AKRMLDGVETDMTISGQVGSVTSKGFELDATVYPMQGMTLSAGYGFTDIRYTKLAKNPYLDVDAEEGNPLTNVPKHNFYTYGSYVFDKGARKGLGLDYSITYTGKS
ncbi:TonB-dependent receptor domain-containing protein, partial [Mesomycoplasma ovipneumoniae]|uniref:TonB-dependent receptor domain-containing protein n=1 Tax=Mesomycoplasma ovipneumoniae TaxID=29562 RepID=UPI00307FFD06